MCSSASQGEPSVTSLRDLAVLGAIFKKQVRHLTRYPGEFIFVLIIPYFLTAIVVAMRTSVGVLAPGHAIGLIWASGLLMVGLIHLFGIGFFFAALLVRFKEPYAFPQAANVLFAVITGTFYSVTVLPFWVQAISSAIPQTFVVQDMRLVIESVNNLFGAAGTILVLLTMAVIYPFLGYSFFKLFEKRAKIHADLSKF